MSELEKQFLEIVQQHVHLSSMHKETAALQGEIAKQILNQHEQIDELLKALGLRKDLSEYSYRVFDGPSH